MDLGETAFKWKKIQSTIHNNTFYPPLIKVWNRKIGTCDVIAYFSLYKTTIRVHAYIMPGIVVRPKICNGTTLIWVLYI